MAKDHEFRNQQRPRSFLGDDVAPVPRNIDSRAISAYKGVPSDLFQSNPGVTAKPGDANKQFDFSTMLYAIQRRGDFQQLQFPYTTAPLLILPATGRLYLLIQNLSAAANMYIGIGRESNGPGAIGLKIIPGGYYEPLVCPQNDIWVSGDAGGSVNILFANAPN